MLLQVDTVCLAVILGRPSHFSEEMTEEWLGGDGERHWEDWIKCKLWSGCNVLENTFFKGKMVLTFFQIFFFDVGFFNVSPFIKHICKCFFNLEYR